MSIKTEYSYNDDDFVERNGQLEELTATITLSEYRGLIQDVERLEAKNYRLNEQLKELHEKKEDLEKRNSALTKMFLRQYPDFTEMFANWIRTSGIEDIINSL